MIDCEFIWNIIRAQIINDSSEVQSMIPETRQRLLLELLRQQRTATVQELAQALESSVSTIRRDLILLDRQGLLQNWIK